MASLRYPTALENLPYEVLSKIFIQLLAKQLAQMRCVCKSWNSLLSESSFVKSHLHHSIHNNDEILLFCRLGVDCSSITTHPSRSPGLELTPSIKFPVNFQHKYIVIGSVNGLICFYYGSYHGHVVGVWNPSLSAVSTLPPFSLASNVIWSGFGLVFGFGFDPKTDDYKVVKFQELSETPHMVLQAEVYSMRKGSWELISQRFPLHITVLRTQNGVCEDGHLHWLFNTVLVLKPESTVTETIVAFDLGAETFSEIPLPNTILNYKAYKCSNVLGILAGKLCVMSCVRDGECEVWVMNEYAVAESWVKHHVFSQFSGEMTPYGFTSHSKFIFQVDDGFALYDPAAAKTKTFKDMPRNGFLYKIVEYVDSLVWIEPANRLQI